MLPKNRFQVLLVLVIIVETSLILFFLLPSQFLPLPHPVPAVFPEPTTTGWRTYQDPQNRFSFSYPNFLIVNNNPSGVSLSHSVPHQNSGGCDMSGNSPILDNLLDFQVTFELKPANFFPYTTSEGTTTISGLTGKYYTNGVEGCGTKEYFLPIKHQTLVVKKTLIQATEFSSQSEEILALPDIISPTKSAEILAQILGSFSITTPAQTTITSKPKLSTPRLLDHSNWINHSCGPISYKLPATYAHKCIQNPDSSQDVLFSETGSYSTNSIYIRKYDGGSRRQWWIKSMTASPSEISKYVRFQETQFGSVPGLDVFASGGWWQGGYVSPILIAKDKILVSIYGGRDFDDQSNKIIRWDITDTIASTIVFN